MSSTRQQIVDAVKARFVAITTGNGYDANVQKLAEWQLTPFEAADLTAITISDPTEETLISDKNSGSYTRQLTIVADAVLTEADATAARARTLLADLVKAVGVDPTWSGLARYSLPVRAEVKVDEAGQRIGGVRLEFIVEYSRKPWAA